MSYYSYNNQGRGGFLSNMPTAIRHIIIINVLVMVMMYLNESFMVSLFYDSRIAFSKFSA